MARTGLATRLYQGEANINIVGRRKIWFTVAALLVVVAVASIAIRGFQLGIEFAGGTSFSGFGGSLGAMGPGRGPWLLGWA